MQLKQYLIDLFIDKKHYLINEYIETSAGIALFGAICILIANLSTDLYSVIELPKKKIGTNEPTYKRKYDTTLSKLTSALLWVLQTWLVTSLTALALLVFLSTLAVVFNFQADLAVPALTAKAFLSLVIETTLLMSIMLVVLSTYLKRQHMRKKCR